MLLTIKTLMCRNRCLTKKDMSNHRKRGVGQKALRTERKTTINPIQIRTRMKCMKRKREGGVDQRDPEIKKILREKNHLMLI